MNLILWVFFSMGRIEYCEAPPDTLITIERAVPPGNIPPIDAILFCGERPTADVMICQDVTRIVPGLVHCREGADIIGPFEDGFEG